MLRFLNRPVGQAILCLTLGCGGPAASPESDLPLYDQAQSQVFDDSLSEDAFGLKGAPRAWEREELFLQRVAEADLVLVGRLRTVSQDEDHDGGRRFRLHIELAEEALHGEMPEDRQLELPVGVGSPSQRMLQLMAPDIVGQPLVLFIRRFQSSEKMVLHFAGELDSPDLRAAIASQRANPTDR